MLLHRTVGIKSFISYFLITSIFLCLLMFWGAETFAASIKVILVLFFVCYLPARCFFHAKEYKSSLSESIIYLLIGLALLSVLSLVFLSCNLPSQLGALLLFSAAIFYLIGNRGYYQYLLPVATTKKMPLVLLFLSISFWVFPNISQTISMGRGAFPEVFYNVDSPYYLEQAYSLVNAKDYPIESLNYHGKTTKYHFGTQNMGAIITKLTGISVNTSMFLVVYPLLLFSSIAALYQISKMYTSIIPAAVYMFFVFMLRPCFWYIFHFFNNLVQMKYPHVLNVVEHIGFHFEMFSTLFAMFVTYMMIISLANLHSKYHQRILTVLVGILIVFKIPWFLSIGLGLACYSVAAIIAKGNWKPFVCGSISAVIACALYVLFLGPELTNSMPSALPFFTEKVPLTRLIKRGILDGSRLYLHFAFIAIFFAFFRFKSKSKGLNGLAFLWWFIIPLYIAYILYFQFIHDGAQLKHFIRFISVILIIDILVSLWRHRKNLVLRWIVLFFCILSVIPFLYVRTKMSWDFVKDPSTGHEYVNNILIADALKEIPINGSLIITNDFRYPADNYSRDLRQLQLPAIYGHQLYACNWVYGRIRGVPDAYQRLTEQRLIRATEWNPIIHTLAKEHGWTHLLLDKSVGTLAKESFWKKGNISFRNSEKIFRGLKRSGIINQGNVLNEKEDISDIVLDNIIGIEYSKNREHIIQVLKQSRMKYPRNIPLPIIYENSRYCVYTLRKTK